MPAVYALLLAAALWIVTERMPLGRHIYAIGANEKAAALNGIPVRKHVIGVFVASGLLVGFTGCVLAAKLQIGQANVGLDYLLPALVGTFLGSTTIRPGRVNVWGTVIGVLILAVGISGIQQLGGAFFVEPLFNGVTLLVSIALAGLAQRRRSDVTQAFDCQPDDFGRCTHEIGTGKMVMGRCHLERRRAAAVAALLASPSGVGGGGTAAARTPVPTRAGTPARTMPISRWRKGTSPRSPRQAHRGRVRPRVPLHRARS